jgi:2-phospho-L-lactate transferase/gluconeogenesis factor (CofD/UPF0052 family)
MKEIPAGLKIVSVGGGTGLSTLLSGLKAFVGKDSLPESHSNARWVETLTAVVTVTDDGGSSGRLREEFQILPPGDIRNCMAASNIASNLMAIYLATALVTSSWRRLPASPAIFLRPSRSAARFWR